MNLKEAKRLKPGAIVREAWGSKKSEGLVLSTTYVKEVHTAKTLCQEKKERYDIVVHWLRDPPTQYDQAYGSSGASKRNPQLRQNWELMVKIHAS
jgi:hypothetical protein|tara:strand:+ start:36016 stop:36300 length:285 start_codon:yes stop_codon:yes gene_type:complete